MKELKNINKKYSLMLKAGFLSFLTISIFMVSCQKMSISDDLAGFDPKGDLSSLEVTLNGPGQASGERILDVGKGKLYTLDDASETPEYADFIMLWSSATGMNLISPLDIGRLNGWSAGKTVNESWLVKNSTTFIKLEASDESLKIYNSVKSSDDIKAAYEEARVKVKEQDNYEKADHGPSSSIRNLNVGDVLFIKTSKDVYAISKVNEVKTGTSGVLSLAYKLDIRNEKSVKPISPDQKIDMYETVLDRPGSNLGNRHLDIITGKTYNVGASVSDEDNAFYHQEKIDLFFGRSASNGLFNLISPDNEDRLELFSAGRRINNTWLIKNKGEIIKIDASDVADSIFLHAYTKDGLHEAYSSAMELVDKQNGYDVDVHGKGGYISQINDGDLLFFKSESKNVLAMAQVGNYSTGTSGSFDLSVKLDRSEEIIVAPSPDALKYGTIKLGGWSSLGPEGNNFHLDLASIARFDPTTVQGNEERVDVLNLWSGAGFVNFMTPTSGAVTAWGASKPIADWDIQNDGVFVRLDLPTADENEIFDNLIDRDGLVAAFNDAEADVTLRPGYDEDNNGPSIRVRRLIDGDIVYFKSNAPGRNLYSAMKVISVIPGSSNGREVVELQIKSNLLSD